MRSVAVRYPTWVTFTRMPTSTWEHLAAARSSGEETSETGLFIQRSEYVRRYDPITARVRRSDFDEFCYFFPAKYDDAELNHSALMSRGWVLQERLLSPRSIYFDDEPRWECSELLATEYYPHGFPWVDSNRRLPIIWGRFTPFRIWNLLMDSRHLFDESKNFKSKRRTHGLVNINAGWR
jgi:hypothetical protein